MIIKHKIKRLITYKKQWNKFKIILNKYKININLK